MSAKLRPDPKGSRRCRSRSQAEQSAVLVAAREQHSRAAGQLRERRLGAATSSAGTTSLTRPPPTARRSRYSAPDAPGSTCTFDLGVRLDPRLRGRSPGRPAGLLPRAGIRAHQPAGPPSSAGERSPTHTAACATTTNHDPRAIADHASLPGEHPVVRRTRRSLSATGLGASHGRTARRVPSARSRPRRRTATAQAHARA